VRCPRCGNENPDGNRFCGQCGATLLAVASAPAAQPERSAAASPAPAATASRPPVPERPHAAEREAEHRPSISGPSFLGLADAPPPPRSRGSLNIDPHGPSHSGNLDYLLEDEEEPASGGAGKIFLILIALALAVGFGYIRFKTHGFPWASAGSNKPATSTQPAPTETTENAPAPTTPSITPEPQPAPSQPAASQPAPSNPAPPNSNASHDNAAAANPPAANPEKNPAVPPATAPADENASKPAEKSDNSEAATNTDNSASDKDADASAAAEPAPKPKPAEPLAKPHAASTPVNRVAEAQKYLYGKGVPQDCDRGLRLLKPLANQADSKAMIELGALYSAGLCTPRDLPTAYRWFAMALRKDPSNDAVQTDLQKLWGEMTQPERQLAIKLTQ
jgi:hypothetical protein